MPVSPLPHGTPGRGDFSYTGLAVSQLQAASTPFNPEANPGELARRIAELGDWFHNLNLHGVSTAPNHFLGDFPNIKWRRISPEIPADLSGATVLDIGCNAGFYSLQMKQRGAKRVLGIDVDERYLSQARFAAQTLGLDIDFEKHSVYDVDQIPGKFDFVLFMGVFYHLRYPLLALDKIIKKIGGKLIFQSMTRGSQNVRQWEENYPFWNEEIFNDPDFPAAYFIEKKYSDDQTNWWIPNRGGIEAMLRSSGLQILSQPEPETWICSPQNPTVNGEYIVDLEMSGRL